MKKLQHIHIIIFTILFVGFLTSFSFALTNFKNMIDTSKNNAAVPVTVPVLTQNKQPYSQADYQKALSMVETTFPNISVVISNNQITILSPNIENEVNVRQTMIAILALDRNLYIYSLCGNTANTCSGNALEIIIKGEKTNTTIVENKV